MLTTWKEKMNETISEAYSTLFVHGGARGPPSRPTRTGCVTLTEFLDLHSKQVTKFRLKRDPRPCKSRYPGKDSDITPTSGAVKYLLYQYTTVSRESRLLVGGLSPSFTTAHPLENIGLVCIFIDRMFVVEDLLFECRNKLGVGGCHGHGYGCFLRTLGRQKKFLFKLSILAKIAARVLWRANPATWTWRMASLQSCVILSVRAEGANNSNFYPASRAEELTNVGTWGESKSVLPDTEMSAAKKKKKKESQQQHSLLLFSCWPC